MPIAFALLVAGLLVAPAPYLPPVSTPIVEHFAAPACRWCPGNRGIDYSPPVGAPVVASAAGVVSFAGSVGGMLFVVVAHADGLRTTYGDLSTITVQTHQRVRQAQVVGTSRSHLHFGVRRGDTYLDPEALLRGARPRPRLVPLSRWGTVVASR